MYKCPKTYKLIQKLFPEIFSVTFAAQLLCYLMLGHVMCIILILGSVSWIRQRPSLQFTPDGPTDGHSDDLLAHRFSQQPARHASV